MTIPPLPRSRGLRIVETASLRRLHQMIFVTLLLDAVDLIVSLARLRHG